MRGGVFEKAVVMLCKGAVDAHIELTGGGGDAASLSNRARVRVA
jgi:hypothetical protein